MCVSFQVLMNPSTHFPKSIPFEKSTFLTLFPVCKIQVAYFDCFPNASYYSSWTLILVSYFKSSWIFLTRFQIPQSWAFTDVMLIWIVLNSRRPFLTCYNFEPVDQNVKIPLALHFRGQIISMFQFWAYDESVWLVFERDSKCNL